MVLKAQRPRTPKLKKRISIICINLSLQLMSDQVYLGIDYPHSLFKKAKSIAWGYHGQGGVQGTVGIPRKWKLSNREECHNSSQTEENQIWTPKWSAWDRTAFQRWWTYTAFTEISGSHHCSFSEKHCCGRKGAWHMLYAVIKQGGGKKTGKRPRSRNMNFVITSYLLLDRLWEADTKGRIL